MPIGSWLETVRAWDVAGFYLINRTLRHTLLDSVVPLMTYWNVALPVGLIFLYVMVFRPKRDRIVAICAIAVILLANETTQLIKELLQRIRPCHVLEHAYIQKGTLCTSSFSLPSNHASNMFAMASVFSYNSKWLAVPCFVAAAFVAYSRVYVGAHYPADVLAGLALGLLVGFPGAIVVERLTRAREQGRSRPFAEGRDEVPAGSGSPQPSGAPGECELR